MAPCPRRAGDTGRSLPAWCQSPGARCALQRPREGQPGSVHTQTWTGQGPGGRRPAALLHPTPPGPCPWPSSVAAVTKSHKLRGTFIKGLEIGVRVGVRVGSSRAQNQGPASCCRLGRRFWKQPLPAARCRRNSASCGYGTQVPLAGSRRPFPASGGRRRPRLAAPSSMAAGQTEAPCRISLATLGPPDNSGHLPPQGHLKKW